MSVPRMFRGLRDDGSFAFDISQPGIDVRFANIMQKAFSSDAKIPSLVAKGQVVINPTNGVRHKDAGLPGGQSTTRTILYGRTITPSPVVAAIASAADWSIPLALGSRSQLGYLANQWHTYVYEAPFKPTQRVDSTYGTDISGNADSNGISPSWASARFTAVVKNTGVDFVMNCATPLTVKYIILEYR